MLFWKTIDIADNERALVFRRNRFEKVLEPGRHRLQQITDHLEVMTYDITRQPFEHPNGKFLLKEYPEKLDAFLEKFELSDHQVGLVYRDGKFEEILVPGSCKLYWKGAEQWTLEIIDIAQCYTVDDRLLATLGRGLKIAQNRYVNQGLSYVEVPDEQVGLLFVNGKFERMLEPGDYGFWKFNRTITVKFLDLRLQSTDVTGQEILTKDRVSLRINLAATYQVKEAVLVALKMADYQSFVYRELQLRLREAVGTQSLDALLEDKDSLNSVIFESVRGKLAEYGVTLVSVGVKDIILPGDMKTILNRVVEAQKESEANLIKRREETQAVRSLHNTAKMMENNPVLLRLKELESLEKVTERIDKISVYGGLDGVLKDLVKIAP